MEMNVRDDQKLVEIWLTNAEKIDPVLREGLKEIYAKYKTKKYMVAVFESGKGDLYENTRVWSDKPWAEGSNPFRPFSFLPKRRFNP